MWKMGGRRVARERGKNGEHPQGEHRRGGVFYREEEIGKKRS